MARGSDFPQFCKVMLCKTLHWNYKKTFINQNQNFASSLSLCFMGILRVATAEPKQGRVVLGTWPNWSCTSITQPLPAQVHGYSSGH
jgi:hypothetical protein